MGKRPWADTLFLRICRNKVLAKKSTDENNAIHKERVMRTSNVWSKCRFVLLVVVWVGMSLGAGLLWQGFISGAYADAVPYPPLLKSAAGANPSSQPSSQPSSRPSSRPSSQPSRVFLLKKFPGEGLDRWRQERLRRLIKIRSEYQRRVLASWHKTQKELLANMRKMRQQIDAARSATRKAFLYFLLFWLGSMFLMYGWYQEKLNKMLMNQDGG